MNFYSDNGVDKFVCGFLPELGYACDVGANDGLFFSNSLHFEEKGWLVLCIEANPLLKESGQKHRKLWRSVACGEEDCDGKDFVCVSQYPYASASGFHTHEIPKGIYDIPIVGQTFKVSVRTLNRMLDESGFPRLDFLTIDTEGHELSVLQGIDLERWTPKIIVAEAWIIPTSITDYLAQWKYKLVHRLEYDNVYLKES